MRRIVSIARQEGVDCEVMYEGTTESTMRSALGQVSHVSEINPSEFTIRLRSKRRYIDFSIPCHSTGTIRESMREHIALLPHLPVAVHLPRMVKQPRRLPEVTQGLQAGALDTIHDTAFKVEAFARMQRPPAGWTTSGRLYVAGGEIAVANSIGLERYHTWNYAALSVIVSRRRKGKQLTAYAYGTALLPADLDVEGIIEEAFGQASLTDSLPVVDFFGDRFTRRCDVILSPYATHTLLEEVLPIEFTGYALDTGTSFLSNLRPGAKVASAAVTITEDWKHAGMVPVPFDFLGQTRQRVPLIERGRYREVLWDSMAAKIANSRSTGHSYLETGDARPYCMVMDGGKENHADLVTRSIRPTVIITYLHYPAISYAKKAILTATTLHGTFLVEHGKYVGVITTPLRLRIPSLEALRRIDGIGKPVLIRDDERYGIDFPLSYFVPELRLRHAVSFLNSAV